MSATRIQCKMTARVTSGQPGEQQGVVMVREAVETTFDNGPEVISAVLPILDPDEELHAAVQATDAVVAVTDRRVIVKTHLHVELAVPFHVLRRIQFDVERDRA